MSVLPVGIGPVTGGYQIERSLRFNSADSAYLSRTMGTPTNANVGSISFWVKRSKLSTTMAIFGTNGTYATCNFNSDDTLSVQVDTSGSPPYKATTAVYRDPSAWMHILYTWDTSNTQNGTPPQQAFYVNGVAITSWSTNQEGTRNLASPAWTTSGKVFYIGYSSNANAYFDGYIAEFYLIDGQEKAYTDFVETDSATGILKPKAYTGTYGANGAYLKFADNSGTTSTTLGKDYSGNGNNWTPNNFSVTAGAGNDSLVDTPTNYGTDTGVGGEVRGNYATWNPLAKGGSTTLSNGNLDVLGSINSTGNNNFSTFIPSSEKWYFEASPANTYAYSYVGVSLDGGLSVSSSFVGGTANSVGVELGNGTIWRNGSNQSTGGTGVSAGEILMVAFEPSSGKVWAGRNGTWYNSGNPAAGTGQVATIPTVGAIGPAVSPYSGSGTISFNFGQRAFSYTAPSGFKALCTQNLPTPTIGATSTTQANDYFNAVLYTGNGSSQSITGVGFQPDFTWIKSRSAATDHALYDAVRGVQLDLVSNSTAAETTQSTGLTAFNSDGFTIGSLAKLNTNTATYVAWGWDANGAGSTNTAGTITSTVSANTTSGFSIVTYTGNNTSGATVGHGLGVKPAFIIVKKRTGTDGWGIYHTSLGATKTMELNTTAAEAASAIPWNNTEPTSSVIYLNGNNYANSSLYTYVMYVFSSVAGYSAFGSYTGNASSDGPFIYTGFRPRYVLIKASSSTGDWVLEDTSRSPYNVSTNYLVANASTAEQTGQLLDFTSNGFKIRVAVSGAMNGSGTTYIYAAFAESPFKYSLAR